MFISHQAADRLGRRYAALAGAVVTCVGGALMAGAHNIGMMIVGRIFSGFGNAIISATVPLYQRFVRRKFCMMNRRLMCG